MIKNVDDFTIMMRITGTGPRIIIHFDIILSKVINNDFKNYIKDTIFNTVQ